MKKIWRIYQQWRDRRLRERCVKYARHNMTGRDTYTEAGLLYMFIKYGHDWKAKGHVF